MVFRDSKSHPGNVQMRKAEPPHGNKESSDERGRQDWLHGCKMDLREEHFGTKM